MNKPNGSPSPKPSQKLQLSKETLRGLKMQTGLKTGQVSRALKQICYGQSVGDTC